MNSIGKIIRTYRKRLGLTQEEVAKRLGVTTPAVNKWENGSNQPDVLLLSPIARLLGITTDELLSFHQQLTEQEVGQFMKELDQCLRAQPYDAAFQLAKLKIEAYPNCGSLIFQAATVLDGWRMMHAVENADQYDEAIHDYFKRLTEGEDETLRDAGAEALFYFAMRQKAHQEAQACLDRLPREDPERKRKQAMLYEKTGKTADAYRTYEELLFTGYQHLNTVMNGLMGLYLAEEDVDSARTMAEKMGALAAVFEMGRYNETSPMLEIAVAQKDAEATAGIMHTLLETTETLAAFTGSPLYRHMQFKAPEAQYFAHIRADILRDFGDEEAFSFMKGNACWEALKKKADAGAENA